ncbi:enoyl-hydratase [Xylariaceae sp. FL0594]|nr:enoyl-hydratase [Xylariaceae sp. FL0594]
MAGPSYTKLPPGLSSSPPPVPSVVVSFPSPNILLVTLSRPKQLNAIPRPMHIALAKLWDWYDEEGSLRCAVLTGEGRAFCAGQDLKEWNAINTSTSSSASSSPPSSTTVPSIKDIPTEEAQNEAGRAHYENDENSRSGGRFPVSGFAGLSNRSGKKPVIAAVNGICFGGGMEAAINCDLVVAAESARFALPEVTIGVIALAGALPRLQRSVGRQRAAEMALGGGTYTADDMFRWGLVNEVVRDEDGGGSSVVKAALKWAERIAGNSPDAVIVSREGLMLGWEGIGPQQGTDVVIKGLYARIEKGENMVEGVKSFVERRKPVWKDSKL